MKILHCCLAAFYIDNFSYQENIFPKIHKLQGHQVHIIASTETYLENIELGYVPARAYLTRENIPIKRVPYVSWLPHFIAKKLRFYTGIKDYLKTVQPDIIFLHDCQFLSIFQIANYAKQHKNVKIYADSHTDFINSGKTWVSKNIFHKIIYRLFCANVIAPYTTKFYGTLPVRVDFLRDIYGIDAQKLELLPFGADDTLFDAADKATIRTDMRRQLNLHDSDFVMITGGKIDARKNIDKLLNAFVELTNEQQIDNIKLILFGKPTSELKAEIQQYTDHPNIRYMEWVSSENIHKYFLASDLAFFPGTHSVLWEEAIGLGLPCVFYKWEGIQHVDVGGNCLFIEDPSVKTLKKTILSVVNDKEQYAKMKEIAQNQGVNTFCYTEIAKRAIENN